MEEKSVILIVDDQPVNIKTLGSILKDLYRIKVATNGNDALKFALTEPKPDLILLDIEMPDISGYDVIKKLKADIKTEEIPVIFVTSHQDVENEELGLELGAVDYISKPVRSPIVKARVKTQLTVKKQYNLLKEIAMKDKLTSLYNRHYLMDEGVRKFANSQRNRVPFSLAILDIDHFKKVNDTHGHTTGDEVLKAVANVIKNGSRKEDFAARFGGEEFILLLEHCTKEDAQKKIETLRVEVENLNPSGINVTASFGVASCNGEQESFESLLKDADEALYEAKENGRNRVVLKEY